uniref:Putative addiction module component, TIGR02574 family n=1 Tax=Candidatus Kentrum sp. LPFa TaxID=2126335 RepID=A0A450XW06_9GAMM|nr:MAG: putative addiction module component, TIGR02574 family [Candidatus Kentron sp. LPFa]VFK33460.1 MAG: putative addiction module component, TIGR02574 family [Candidatus Kentron sp. LPFa]
MDTSIIMNLQKIESEALHLPEPARAELAQKLFDSLDTCAEPDQVRTEWLLEAQRRADEIDRGVVQLVSSEEVARKARALLG